MKQAYTLVYLLLLFISGYETQEPTTPPSPDWHGDPLLCRVDGSLTPAPNPPPTPQFSKKAEFAVEIVQDVIAGNTTIASTLAMSEFIYDYNANSLIQVRNERGLISVDFFYYGKLKKATYIRGDLCVVTNISKDVPMDGTSAIMVPGQQDPHIRPLNEFLLFSHMDLPNTEFRTVYIGTDTVRGIPVDKWESCYINRANYTTMRRVWSFAQKGVITPSGPVGDLAVPVEAVIKVSVDLPDGTRVQELDQIFNVISYKQGITETSAALSPPKGVYCNFGEDQNLLSLNETGITWPDHFSVRVDASNSRNDRWERFHLRYTQDDEGRPRRIRYDYMPPNGEDYESVIHDYSHNLTFVIDRRIGSCQISNGVRHPEVSPMRDPVTFFMKHEARFIFHPRQKAWEFNGFRFCRGDTIQCTILTTSILNFPAMVDSDTGVLSGDTWAATHMEYGWGVRAPLASPAPGKQKGYDYPVSLYLRMFRYQDPSDPSILGLRHEDVEYEFYEMSYDTDQNDFDTTICYRAGGYEYLHLVFVLTTDSSDALGRNHIDRHELQRRLHRALGSRADIGRSRVSEVEVDHEEVSNDVTVFFTLLGKTPNPASPSGVVDAEPSAATARETLQGVIDKGQFEINMRLIDQTEVKFTAKSGSLKYSKQYISTHSSGKRVINESYTSGSQATAILVGALVGLIVGAIIAAVIRVVLKKPMPKLPTSVSNPLPTINFRSKQTADTSASKTATDA